MKCLKITYDVNQEYKSAYLNADSPDKGIYHFFNLTGKDDKGNEYIVNLVHSGFTPEGAESLDLVATFNIYSIKNKNVLLVNETFSTKTTPEGIFLKGNYYSPNKSKLIVDDSPVRTMYFCVKY